MLRTDKSSVLWAPESVYGALAVSGYQRFGFHGNAELPNPQYGWFPYFDTKAPRRVNIIKGRQTLSGGINGIGLQNANFLTYLTTQNDTSPISSFSLAATSYDTDGVPLLNRMYSGGKIGRAILSAKEGEELKLSIEDMQFNNMFHNRLNAVTGRYIATIPTDPGASDDERWVFSGADIRFSGITLGKVREFTVSINNSLQPYYGLKSNASVDVVQSPHRILSGQQQYSLRLAVDMADSGELALWDYLLNQGAATNISPTTGLTFTGIFARNGTTLSINCSTSTPTTNPATVLTGIEDTFDVSKGYYKVTFLGNIDKITFTET